MLAIFVKNIHENVSFLAYLYFHKVNKYLTFETYIKIKNQYKISKLINICPTIYVLPFKI